MIWGVFPYFWFNTHMQLSALCRYDPICPGTGPPEVWRQWALRKTSKAFGRRAQCAAMRSARHQPRLSQDRWLRVAPVSLVVAAVVLILILILISLHLIMRTTEVGYCIQQSPRSTVKRKDSRIKCTSNRVESYQIDTQGVKKVLTSRSRVSIVSR